MSKKIKETRKKIDALDQKIHDALIQRAELVEQIVKEKGDHDLQVIHPAREAQMIRKRMEHHTGKFPQTAIVRMWRELVCAGSLLRMGQKISVCVEGEDSNVWDHAKAYFGSLVSMKKSSSALGALASVRESNSVFSVLPWPQDSEDPAWWGLLFDQDEDIKIVIALPYGDIENESNDLQHKALVVSKIPFDSSGKDHSFVALQINQSISRSRIVEFFKEQNIEILSIASVVKSDDQGHSLHLIEVDDYISETDDRLIGFAQHFEEFEARCKVLGGYPVAPLYKKGDVPVVENKIPSAPSEE